MPKAPRIGWITISAVFVVSRKLRQPESVLGVRVLHRTRRRQSLIGEGHLLYAQAVHQTNRIVQKECIEFHKDLLFKDIDALFYEKLIGSPGRITNCAISDNAGFTRY